MEFVESGKVLLFPGDAQVGNWLSWDDVRWEGEYSEVSSASPLSRTAFYKVGHHGSHNATLQDKGLERMVSQNLVATIPVSQEMAVKKRWRMPYKPLLERLNQRCSGRVVISDVGLPDSHGNTALEDIQRQIQDFT